MDSTVMPTTVTPRWAETSVRWLRTHAPAYVHATSKKTFTQQLFDALIVLKYYETEMFGFPVEDRKRYLGNMVDNWNAASHSSLVKYINERKHLLPRKAAMITPKEAAEADAFVAAGGVVIEDEIEKLEDAGMVKPRSQLSPRHELEEIVAEAALKQDPRFGVW